MTTAVTGNRESQTQMAVFECCKRAVNWEAIWRENVPQLQGGMETCDVNKRHQNTEVEGHYTGEG